MCGFAGEFCFAGGTARIDVARAMARRLVHRGPDEAGEYLSTDGRLAIGFRRLRVIDPRSSRQPMISPDGRHVIAYNGECYNYRSLRHDMGTQGIRFRTRGDTEVVLQRLAQSGANGLSVLEGMFALALYDTEEGKLLLARDPVGQKPLWYATVGGRVVFASEAKALLTHPDVSHAADVVAVTNYYSVGYIPAPRTAWRDVRKLSAGAYVVVGPHGMSDPARYWTPPDDTQPPAADPIEWLRETLPQTVEKLMVADVPLGVLLSGGLDSSIVAALMCKAAGKAGGVRTFTAGFGDAGYDERPAARAVADHCGSEHTEIEVSADPTDAVGRIVEMYDEPFADSSALATHRVCRAAREHVTVALCGDGGDEAFGGYDRYRAMHLAETMSPAKYLGVRVAAGLAGTIAPRAERSGLRRLVRFAEGLGRPPALQYLHYRSLFPQEDLRRLFTAEFAAFADLDEPARWFSDLYERGEAPDEAGRAQRHDVLTYLPDDLLVKTDIASMACSLELRSPFLETRILEFGMSLPASLKLRRGRGKAILREAFGHLLPAETLRRPKRGFALPLAEWLRGPLRETLVETLTDRAFLGAGIVREEAVWGLLNDHLRGRADYQHRLWALLVHAAWLARGT